MKAKPLILVSNDDGTFAKGIQSLVSFIKDMGEVVVVAPDSPQSGMGHAITIGNTIRLDRTDIFGDIEAYECSGTPADCVKLAKHHVLKDRKPDLVLSGINHGSNSSVSVLYSGTMSAAIEAALEGLPAIGFSLCNYEHNADFEPVKKYVRAIVAKALEKGLPQNIALNVNFPAVPEDQIKGIKVCRQAHARWQEEFEQRKDPRGRDYFWLTGSFVNLDKGGDTDEDALKANYVSVVPVTFDLTAYSVLSRIQNDFS
jgi:5'-nucleotidase